MLFETLLTLSQQPKAMLHQLRKLVLAGGTQTIPKIFNWDFPSHKWDKGYKAGDKGYIKWKVNLDLLLKPRKIKIIPLRRPFSRLGFAKALLCKAKK